MKPLAEIVKLNQTRYGLDFNGQKAIEKLHEEIIEEFKPHFESNDIEAMVDDLSKIIGASASYLAQLGYNPELVMKQHVKSLTDSSYSPNFGTCKLNSKAS